MKIRYLLFVFILIFSGCTSAGSKFIHVQYLGKAEASKVLNIGISPFVDQRQNIDKKYIGKRILNSGNEEIYYVDDLSVADTITKSFESHLKNKGYSFTKINDWSHDVNALKKINRKFQYIIGGEIKEFEFFANKGYATSTNLDITLVIYIGDIQNNKLTKVPVHLNLVRKDIKFSKEKVEKFINESLTEIILKSLIL